MKVTDKITITNEDNMELMKRLPNESIDIICIDPPYLYLKNQKLERTFDEQLFFEECRRLLTKDGMLVMFGRGVSFYRWNMILDSLGFNFKEEIVWDKKQISSPLNAVLRVHENVVIFSKGKGVINRVKNQIVESYKYEPEKIESMVKRLQSAFGNRNSFNMILEYFSNGEAPLIETRKRKFETTVSSNIKNRNRTLQFAIGIEEGVTEKTIISESREHYGHIHPTQKPVKLLQRLISLVAPADKEPKDVVVADFFGGSFSTMEAVHNMGMQGIACEIDKEYFELGKKRIETLTSQQKLF